MGKNDEGAFDCLRLLAALAVLFSHSFPLLGRNDEEPLLALTHGQIDIRGTAVYVFFAISGYLVTQSWARDPSPARFMVRRSLRLLPGLALVIVGSVFLLGPLTTERPLLNYLAQPETWSFLTKILIYPGQYGLPGCFEGNPFPKVVNGSLWSLRLEFSLYLLLVLLGSLKLLRARATTFVIATLCAASLLSTTAVHVLSSLPLAHQIFVSLVNALPFFIGATLAQSKLDNKFFYSALAGIVLTTLALSSTRYFPLLFLIALPFVIIGLARFGRCDLRRFGDYSYGIYLWGFPIQQAVIHFLPSVTPTELFFLAVIPVFAFAFISWHLVEKRALLLKPRARKETVIA